MSQLVQIIIIVVLILLIVLSAFFSAAETAYSSISEAKVINDVEKKRKIGKLIQKQRETFGKLLSVILIMNNLVNILATTLITLLFNAIFDSTTTITLVSTLVMTPIIVIFGEIFPKLLARKYSYGYVKKIAFILEVITWFLTPITFFLSKVTLKSRVTNTENEIKTMITIAKKERVLEKGEATLATNALDLDSTKVRNIYVKLKNIQYIKYEDNLKTAREIFSKTGYSRLPVFKKSNLIGIILLKQIAFKGEGDVKDYVKELPNVSIGQSAVAALEKLRKNSTHMAFVVEKTTSKKVLGLITLEDIFEELVGEIYDEHDKQNSIFQIGLHKLLSNGNSKMSQLEKLVNKTFEDSKDKTVKQWLLARINRKIKKGLTYTYKKEFRFKVIENKKNKDMKIEITQR